MSKVYTGYRQLGQGIDGQPGCTQECVVTVRVNGRPCRLRLRLDIRNHSPTGFEWGYGGSGPAQLALALVADCCGRAAAVPGIYQRVKASIVSRFAHDGWTLTELELLKAVEEARAAMALATPIPPKEDQFSERTTP